jgi:hypothetical protein
MINRGVIRCQIEPKLKNMLDKDQISKISSIRKSGGIIVGNRVIIVIEKKAVNIF